MFYKYLEFFIFLQKKGDVHANFKFSGINSILTSLFIFFWTLIATGSFVTKTVFFSLAFFFIAYWLISVFVYLLKKAAYSTYTRIIQRFWKRALYLFWVLEISLFTIYMFLALISPQEVAYMLDNTQLFYYYNNTFNTFFNNLLRLLFVVLLANIWVLSHKYKTYNKLLTITIGLLLILSLMEDITQFYGISQSYLNYTWLHAPTTEVNADVINGFYNNSGSVWELESSDIKLRTSMHYLYLLIFLKMVHTVFIIYYFVFFENACLLIKNESFNIISSNLQNMYFLMFFGFILKISLLKDYLIYIGGHAYYWFFLNYHYCDFSYMQSIFKIEYFLYVINDIYNAFI